MLIILVQLSCEHFRSDNNLREVKAVINLFQAEHTLYGLDPLGLL